MSDRDDGTGGGGNGSSTSLDDGATQVRSFVDRETHTVLARGAFEPLQKAYVAHAAGLGPLPAVEALELMGEALSLAALQLALLPPDQYCSWTYNLVEPTVNLFLAGDNGGFNLTGRVYTEHVQTQETSRLFVETQRPRYKVARSVVDFEGRAVSAALEQYFSRSLQMRSRFFALGEDRLLIQGLPNADREWFAGLDEATVEAMFDRGLEKIEERTYRFYCGCDADRIKALIREIFTKSPEELFAGDDQVEVQCPRCGCYWQITRSDLEAGEA